MDAEHLFNDILDRDEKVLWAGRPNFTTFMCTGLPLLGIGIIWGILDLCFIMVAFGRQTIGHGPPLLFIVPFFAVHLFPCWGSVLYMFWLYFSYGNTAYAFTNKRVMIRSGVFGIDYQIIDYDKIRDYQVNIGPIENMFGVGSVLFNTGEVSHKGHPMLKRFSGIENPYDVFRQLKETTVNVKTDWNYPNAMRPDANPGYNTKYDPSTE
jgi:membrane protein YdbS with pleckstrin-like domain